MTCRWSRELQFLTTDINSTIRLSMEMARQCKDIAAELGYATHLFAIPPGGGGTDAAEFAKIGDFNTLIESHEKSTSFAMANFFGGEWRRIKDAKLEIYESLGYCLDWNNQRKDDKK